jgi:Retrotransposon gag protein
LQALLHYRTYALARYTSDYPSSDTSNPEALPTRENEEFAFPMQATREAQHTSSGHQQTAQSQETSTLRGIWNARKKELAHLWEIVKKQAEDVDRLLNSIPTLTARLSANVVTPRIKIAPPEKFSGQRDTLHEFLAKCQHKFLIEPESFPQEHEKTLWASSYLEGTAYNWFRPIFDAFQRHPLTPPPEFSSYAKFEESLKAAFGDPDETAHHERQITSLKQLGSATAYATQFRIHQGFINWNDDALTSTFRAGLKPAVKDALIYANPLPKQLKSLIEVAIRIDSRLHERELEKKHEAMTSATSTPATSTSTILTLTTLTSNSTN